MAIYIRFHIKDFNPDRLREDFGALASLFNSMSWAGFAQIGDRQYTPNPARKLVAVSVVNGVRTENFADPGELRFTTSRTLTSIEETQLDGLLSAHDWTQLSAEQVRQDTDKAELDALLGTERQIYKDHLAAWDGYNNIEKAAATKEMFQIVGKVLRLFIRSQRSAEI